MRKVCNFCDEEKDEREFHLSRKTGRLEDVCMECKKLRLHTPLQRRHGEGWRPVVDLWD